MEKSRFREIIGPLKWAEAGMAIKELCQVGTEVTDAKRLKELEARMRRSRRFRPEVHLDIYALKGVFGAKR